MLRLSILLLIFSACTVYCDVESTCCERDTSITLLNTAIDIISKAKYNNSVCEDCLKNQKAFDCSDILQMGYNTSGVYKVWLKSRAFEDKQISVYCDMKTDGGGWTVIQRRGDFGRAKNYFYKDWKSYKDGFGNLEKDFWLGNDYIFALTSLKHHSVRFDLEDFEQNKRYALYDTFWIDDEYNKYTLHISDYSGNAGDSMVYHYRQRFSTKDQRNDKHNGDDCAVLKKGAWWYKSCYEANLNGLYYNGKKEIHPDGINWIGWYENKTSPSLKWTEIKIRPKNFLPIPITKIGT